MMYVLCVMMLLVLASYVIVAVWCVRTLIMIWEKADTITILFVALTYIMPIWPLPRYLHNDLQVLKAKVSGSHVVAGSPFFLSIAIFAVVAMMPAMGPSPELGAVWQLAMAILILLQYLFLYSLYNGITAADSYLLTTRLALPLDVSENNVHPRNYYEVDPPHPRFLLA